MVVSSSSRKYIDRPLTMLLLHLIKGAALGYLHNRNLETFSFQIT